MDTTTEHAYDTAMEQVERGRVPVCIPGEDDDGPFVLTMWTPVLDDEARGAYAIGATRAAHGRLRTL